jgi:hypothetical protein
MARLELTLLDRTNNPAPYQMPGPQVWNGN